MGAAGEMAGPGTGVGEGDGCNGVGGGVIVGAGVPVGAGGGVGEGSGVAVARAVVGNQSLILADEPTGNLDSAHGQEVMEMLQQLNDEGTTIIMVTHSQSHADFAKRTVNLLDGSIITQSRRVDENIPEQSHGVI